MHQKLEKTSISKIIFVIEVYARDLPGRYEIATRLKAYGFSVYIIEQELLRRLPSYFFKHALVYDKSIANSQTRLTFYKRVRRAGGYIAVEDEESNVVFSDPSRYINARTHPDLLAEIEIMFCWNSMQEHHLRKNYKNFEDKFVITGSSKYGVFEKSVATTNILQSRNILVPSNFSLLTNYSTLEEYIEFRKKLETEVLSDIGAYEHLWKQTVDNLNWVKNHSKKHIINIRPHPSDNLEKLKSLFKDCDNIKVLEPAPLIDDLCSHSDIYHFNCNSAIEAQMCNVNVKNISKNPAEYLSQNYRDVVGTGATQKIINIIKSKYKIHDKIYQKEPNFNLYIRLLAAEYLMRRCLRRNVSKNLNKKNNDFIAQDLKKQITPFLNHGYQSL